jgi:hypothetical protein
MQSVMRKKLINEKRCAPSDKKTAETILIRKKNLRSAIMTSMLQGIR